MGPFIFNASRFLLGALCLLLVLVWEKQNKTLTKFVKPSGYQHFVLTLKLFGFNPLLGGGILCGIVLFMAVGLQQLGLCTTSVGKAGFITSLYIVFVPLINVAFGKKLPFGIVCCVLLAILGMYLLCVQEDLSLSLGDGYVLLCAVASAVHILLIGYIAPAVEAIRFTVVQFFVCSLLSAFVALYLEDINFSYLLNGSQPLLYTGIFSCAFAYTLQILGQKTINPVLASLIFSFEAVFAAIAGWVILGHILTLREIAGCLLIFMAIVAAQSPRFWQGKISGKRVDF